MRIGMVFQKPNPFPKSIFENVAYGLRVRGLRSNARARGGGRAGAAARRDLGRGQGPPVELRPVAVRRPAAAPVHRARARDRTRDPAVRRADLGARPDRDGAHRGADRRAARPGHGDHRHPQHAAGRPRVRLHRLHVPGRADRVRQHRASCSPIRRRKRPRTTSPAVSAERRGTGHGRELANRTRSSPTTARCRSCVSARTRWACWSRTRCKTAVRALLEADREAAEQVLAREQQINEYQTRSRPRASGCWRARRRSRATCA